MGVLIIFLIFESFKGSKIIDVLILFTSCIPAFEKIGDCGMLFCWGVTGDLSFCNAGGGVREKEKFISFLLSFRFFLSFDSLDSEINLRFLLSSADFMETVDCMMLMNVHKKDVRNQSVD